MPFHRQDDRRLVWQGGGESVWIEPWGKDTLRVRGTLAPTPLSLPGALLDPAPTTPDIVIREDRAVIVNGKLRAEVASGGRIRFLRQDTGAVLLEEAVPDFFTSPERDYKARSSDLFHIEVRFRAYRDERFYGLGQYPHGQLDQKGCVLDLVQRNNQVPIPFLLSSRGYGFVWHNPAVGRVELAHNGTRWVAEAARQIDYLVMTGDSWAQLMTRYADVTGYPPMMPEWGVGFWHCKMRYRSQQELLDVAREHRRRGLPLSVINIDYFHWPAQGDWCFDPRDWPDPARMVRELQEMGIQILLSIWPTVNPVSKNYYTMKERGWLVRTERGLPFLMTFVDTKSEGPVNLQFYDATHPEAREFIWNQVREGYYRHGIKIWWLDSCEPDIRPMDHDNLRFHIGNGLEVANLYPLLHQQAFYEGMQAEGEQEMIMLCRAGWLGSQRYAASIWSGDIDSTFESLQEQVRAGLNMSLSGIPWWSSDIGGFKRGDVNDTDYFKSDGFRELVVRWFQYGVFCPVCRLAGVREVLDFANIRTLGADNEVWTYGEEAYRIIAKYLSLRERLGPYILDQMRLAHEQGQPVMRPLFFDFEADPACIRVDDQFMFGPEIMVAPVVFQGMTHRNVYLPDGVRWTEAWTGRTLEGGQDVTVETPLHLIPVYLRGTSSQLRSLFLGEAGSSP